MRAIVRAGAAAALLSVAVYHREPLPAESHESRESRIPSSAAVQPVAACPAGTLPDDGVCIPVPPPIEQGPELTSETNQHRDRQGRLTRYEHIPRRPERPADYRRYRLPVAATDPGSLVSSGYDLHLPDGAQRRGAHLKAVGHGGLDIAAPRGSPVHLLRLEHQEGDAEVVFVGELFGTSVVTRHAVREGPALRDYLVVHGHLERAAAGLRKGEPLSAAAVLGTVGDTGSPGAVHLHLEIRRVRDGVRFRELSPRELVHNARTIACDPRNLLELLPG